MQPIEPIVAPSTNTNENDCDDFGTIEIEEYEEIVCRMQAKKWVDSLIIAPNSQPSTSSSESRRPGSRC